MTTFALGATVFCWESKLKVSFKSDTKTRNFHCIRFYGSKKQKLLKYILTGTLLLSLIIMMNMEIKIT